jgi:hypothetical protein
MSKRGEINGWKCERTPEPIRKQFPDMEERPYCDAIMYAVHVDDGVTPMFLACRTEGCGGMATSRMYVVEVTDEVLDAIEHEWYRPSEDEMVALDRPMYDHVAQGGLMLRELTDAGRAVIEEVRG